MTDFCTGQRVKVTLTLKRFIDEEALPGTGLSSAAFWEGFDHIALEFAPRNERLLVERDRLRSELDAWHAVHPGPVRDGPAYRRFLESVGYLQPVPGPVRVTTCNVDREVSDLSGPQLLASASDAGEVLNAANARWGSLYDTLYDTDVIPSAHGTETGAGYNPLRGAKVAVFARELLDQVAPLAGASHLAARSYRIEDRQLRVRLINGDETSLQHPEKYRGYQGPPARPSAVLLRNNGLHIEIQFNLRGAVGCTDVTGIKDLLIESALTAVIGFEPAREAADTDARITAWRNWLGLMKGDLSATLTRNGQTIDRRLNPDRCYHTAHGGELKLPGRSLLFVGNAGPSTFCPAILDHDGQPLPGGILDGIMAGLIGRHDLKRRGNSRAGSVYILTSDLHGPDEVAFADRLFTAIEDVLGLQRHALKMGISDENRRTSANLEACIHAAAQRMVLISTGFPDRTGDDLHIGKTAGTAADEERMTDRLWMEAHERNTVLTSLACGLRGRAQIGKGLWPMPERMAAMLERKIAHPRSGATTAWVSSPAAATLHALHYHKVDVRAVQRSLEKSHAPDVAEQLLDDLLRVRWSTHG